MRQGGQYPPYQMHFYLTTTSPEKEHDRLFSGVSTPSLTTTNPENEHDCLFSGFQPFSDNHQPREQAQPLVFGVWLVS